MAQPIEPSAYRFAPRRPLGRTGFVATQLGIGDLADRGMSLDDCAAIARRAIDAGLNVIDTAPMYEAGYSEQIVGRAVAGRRERMFVIDKIDQLDQPVGPQVEQSLARLGLAGVDLFVFHSVSETAAWRELTSPGGGFDQLDSARQAGKCRFRGISSHNADVLRDAVASELCDVVMFPVGPFCDERYINEILPLARRHGVGTVCFKTFAAGKLVADTEGYGQPIKARPRGKFSSGGQPAAATALPTMPVADCVHYTLTCDPDVTLLGLSYPGEQDAAFAAAVTFQPLPPARMAEIRQRAVECVRDKGRIWWGPHRD